MSRSSSETSWVWGLPEMHMILSTKRASFWPVYLGWPGPGSVMSPIIKKNMVERSQQDGICRWSWGPERNPSILTIGSTMLRTKNWGSLAFFFFSGLLIVLFWREKNCCFPLRMIKRKKNNPTLAHMNVSKIFQCWHLRVPVNCWEQAKGPTLNITACPSKQLWLLAGALVTGPIGRPPRRQWGSSLDPHLRSQPGLPTLRFLQSVIPSTLHVATARTVRYVQG